MIDVNKITSVLAKLPDAALQQYAAMHKQDPFILPLAIEESNRRKEMRAAPQAMQGQQPPVNDQALQAMLPEDTGIAQLPMQAPPVTSAAHGGIISFAAGGGPDATQAPYQLVDVARARLQEAERTLNSYGMKQRLMDRGGYENARQNYEAAKQAVNEAMATYQSQLPKELYGPVPLKPSGLMAGNLIPAESVQMPPAPGEYAAEGSPATPAEAAALSGETMRAQRTAPPTSPPTGGAQPRPQPRPDAGLGALSGATTAGASYKPMTQAELIQKQIDARKALSAEDPAREAADAAAKADAEAAEKRFAEYQAALPKGKAYEGLEASLKKEEADLPQKKEENLKMALVTAGLGMLAGTSQYAMVNIGKGGERGVEAHEKGRDKLEKAAERRQEMYAKIEEARRAEARGDAKDAYSLRKEADDIKAAWRKDSIAAVRDMFKVNDAAARNIVDNIVRQESIKGQYDIAAMRERGETARSNARISAQDRGMSKELLARYITTLNTELAGLDKQLSNALLTPAEKLELESKRSRVSKELTNFRKYAATELKIPGMPEETTLPPGSRAPLDTFYRK